MRALLFFMLLWAKSNLVFSDDPSCPRNYTNANGAIVNTPGNCIFYISSNDIAANGIITLVLNKLQLVGTDTLVVIDGSSQANIISYNSSSIVKSQVVVGLTNNVTLIYTSNNKNSAWSLNYDSTKCEVNVMNAWTSKLESPFYGTKAGRKLTCVYNVVSSASPPDYTSVVSLSQFSLNGGSTLNVTNGKTTTLFSDTSRNDIFAQDLETNNFTIGLSVLDAGSIQRFTLIVGTVVAGCSGAKPLNGFFEWTKLPVQYVGYECRLLITTASTDKSIIANISSLSIAANSDRLTFIDGGSSNGSVLTTVTNGVGIKDYIVTGSGSSKSMIVSLIVDYTETDRSINLIVTESDSWSRLTEQGSLTFQSKTNNATKYFQLVAKQGQLASVDIATLPEGTTVTFYRGLQIRDGQLTVVGNKDNTLKNVIGNNNMLVEVDVLKTGSSFSANFTSIESDCNKLATDTSGQVTFSGQSNPSCKLTIAPQNLPDSMTIIVNTDFLQLGANSYVRVYQGLDNPVLVAQFSGPRTSNVNPLQIYIPAVDTASVVVQKDPSATATSPTAYISYKTVEKACGFQLQDNDTSFTTPNYPQYPLNAKCAWTSATAANKSLFLSFIDLQLVQNHSISIVNRTSKQVLVNYTNTQGSVNLPSDVVVNWTSDIQVEFQSSKNVSGDINQVARGANITYFIMDCGSSLNGSGLFNTTGYPNKTNCAWVISVRSEDPKITNIVNFSINAVNSKKLEPIFKIYDGDSIRSKTLTLNFTKPGFYLSRFDKIIVVANYNGTNTTEVGFTFNFTTSTCKKFCDNKICLHEDWICNKVDDCGDFTDERNCTYGPIPAPPITPTPSTDSYSGWVKSGWVPACLFIGVLLGAILVFAVPRIIRRIRGRGGNYSRMGDNTVNA